MSRGFSRTAAEGPPMVAVPLEIEVVSGVSLVIQAVAAAGGKRAGQYRLNVRGLANRNPTSYSPTLVRADLKIALWVLWQKVRDSSFPSVDSILAMMEQHGAGGPLGGPGGAGGAPATDG